MQDAELVQPVPYFASGLGFAVVRRPRQAVFHQGLRQTVHEVLRGFPEIPLEMTGEAGVIVEDSQQQRRPPLPPLVKHAERAEGHRPWVYSVS